MRSEGAARGGDKWGHYSMAELLAWCCRLSGHVDELVVIIRGVVMCIVPGTAAPVPGTAGTATLLSSDISGMG